MYTVMHIYEMYIWICMCIVLYKYTAMDFNAGNKISCIESPQIVTKSEFIRMYIDILLEDQVHLPSFS